MFFNCNIYQLYFFTNFFNKLLRLLRPCTCFYKISSLLAARWSKLYFISISSFLTCFITAQDCSLTYSFEKELNWTAPSRKSSPGLQRKGKHLAFHSPLKRHWTSHSLKFSHSLIILQIFFKNKVLIFKKKIPSFKDGLESHKCSTILW
jgi:hypothetical protein